MPDGHNTLIFVRKGKLRLPGGETLGEVREVLRTGGTEILVVENGDREYLIPFAGTICTDPSARRSAIS